MQSQPSAGVLVARMGVGEVLDAGITLARRNYRSLLLLAAWALVPAYALFALASVLLARPFDLQSGDPTQLARLVVLGGLSGVVVGIGFVIAQLGVVIACAR